MTQKDKSRLENAISEDRFETKVQANMISQAVRLYEAADLLVRMYERRLKLSNMGLKREYKKMFSELSRDAHHLKFHVENFSKMYYDAYENKVIEKMDSFQDSGFIYASLAIIMGDGCDSNEKMNAIIDKALEFCTGESVNQEIIDFIRPKR